MTVLVRCINMSRYYGLNVGIEDVSLIIDRPGIYALIGHNGAGKTTFIRLLIGLLKPSKGHVEVLGYSPFNYPSIRRYVGYLGESIGLYSDLTVRRNLEVFCMFRFGSKEVCRKYVDDILHMLGLQNIMNKKPKILSRGNIQKAILARALIGDPKIILLDEPFTALDTVMRSRLRYLLRQLSKEGKLIIFSSHVLTEIELMADYYIILKNGHLIFYGNISDLRRIVPTDRKRILVIEAEKPDLLGNHLKSHGLRVLKIDNQSKKLEVDFSGYDADYVLRLASESGAGIIKTYIRELTLEYLYMVLEGMSYEYKDIC